MTLAQLFFARITSSSPVARGVRSRRRRSQAKTGRFVLEALENRLLLDAVVEHWVGGSGTWWIGYRDNGLVPTISEATAYDVGVDTGTAPALQYAVPTT